MGFLKQFEGMQFLVVLELEWFVLEYDVFQKFLFIFDLLFILLDDGQYVDIYKLWICVCGNLEWVFFWFQIIFNVYFVLMRKIVVVKQNYCCVGCGIWIDFDYIK